MHKVSLALAVAATSSIALAQNCNTSPPASSIRTYDPWAASFYYGNLADNTLNQMMDLNVQTPVEVTSINVTTYDQNAGNPVVPDQQGNVAWVNFYTHPVTRVGAETSMTNWTLIGSGELTVVAWNGDSPIGNFKDANGVALPNGLPLPAGQYGFCVEVIPTNWVDPSYAAVPQTNVPLLNPGAIHTIGVSPNPAITWSDQFIEISNDGIQTNGWQTVDVANGGVLIANAAPSGVVDSSNIEFNYTPDAAAAVSVEFGEGCYNRPKTYYESFPENSQPSDIDSSGWTFIPSGSEYIHVPGPGYSAPNAAATRLDTGTFTSSSSASWDDACITQPLGFSFPHPGGTVTDITINSNGLVYLGLTTDGSFATCGSNYGSTATFRDGPPGGGPNGVIACWNADMDPSDPLMPATGGIFFYFDSTNNFAEIHWHEVPNWPAVAGENCSCMLRLYPSGQIEFAYGSLFNSAAASGNTAIVGYSAVDGTIDDPIDWSAANGALTGDGAFPPHLFVDGRPIAGQSVDIVGDNLSPGTAAGFVSIGLIGLPSPGFDLGPFGLPGCSTNLGLGGIVTSVFLFANPQNELRWTWNVPTGFNGTQTFLQMGTITAGFNPAGILVTNALCAKIGT